MIAMLVHREHWAGMSVRYVLLLLGALFMLISSMMSYQDTPKPHRYDDRIRINDSTTLDATYFVPDQAPPLHGYPAIIFVHGFGRDKNKMMDGCLYYAGVGYLTLCYTVRGHGASDGYSTIMAGTERCDLAKVVEYVRKLPHVDSGAVGILGGSQGGLHGLWAACDRLPVRAIYAGLIKPDWASDLFANGCIRKTFADLLFDKNVRYSSIRDSLWSLVCADQYGELARRFSRGRDLDPTVLLRSNVPTFFILAWQDHFFTANGGFDVYARYQGPKCLYIGTSGHSSDVVPAELQLRDNIGRQWFDRYLAGNTSVNSYDGSIIYAYSALPQDTSGYFTWKHKLTNRISIGDTRTVYFYIAGDSMLARRPPTAKGPHVITLANSYTDSVYNMDSASVQGFQGERFANALPQHVVAFNSKPLTADLFWFGAPTMRLFLQSEDKKFPLHMQIYEVDRQGHKFFVNRINFIARNWRSGERRMVEVSGIAHAHRFERGSRIRIEFTNIDRTNRKGDYGTPFVLPLLFNSRVTMYYGRSYPSRIGIPVLRKYSL